MKEEWKAVKGVDGYEVSNLGRVRSLNKVVVATDGSLHFYKGKLLSTKYANRDGYVTVSLGKDAKGTLVHRIVAEAFIPNPENKPVVKHKDGDPRNNRADNLEWGEREFVKG